MKSIWKYVLQFVPIIFSRIHLYSIRNDSFLLRLRQCKKMENKEKKGKMHLTGRLGLWIFARSSSHCCVAAVSYTSDVGRKDARELKER